MCKKGRMFRLLTADEIVARVASYSAKGASLLLYKTARTDIALLNETVGPLNWKKSHEIVNGFVTCTLSIWDDEKKEWISKTDVGTEDNAAKDKDSTADDQDKADDKKAGKDANSNLATKSKYSDSLKRAGFCWGLGIELYTAPFIWVPASKGGNKNLKATVSEIGYDENDRINRLVLTDRNGNVIYSFGTQQTPAKPAAVNDNSDLVAKLRAKLEEKRVPEKYVTDAYKVDALEKVSASAVATMLTPAGIAKIFNSYQKTLEKEKQFNLFANLPDELPYD